MPDPIQTAADAALVPRIAAGDRAAFAELFRRRQGNVYRFALHMTGEPAVADDVTQEVFLVVMREAARFRETKGSVLAWLCGIARNHVLRRIAGQQRLVTLSDNEDAHPAAAFDPVVDIERAETIEDVRAAVLALPVAYREAVVLCDLQEVSYTEASEALGCPVGTVRSRLHRGRALLGEMLAARVGKRWIA